MNKYELLRITCATPVTAVGNPVANVDAMLDVLGQATDSDVVLFPELSITAYTCADLFEQAVLLESGRDHALRLTEATRGRRQIVVAGLPVPLGHSLYNCALVVSDGDILGLVPKQFIPNYKEFYEGRWFRAANGSEPAEIDFGGHRVSFGIDLLFQARDVVIGVEICEDLWMPIPPSSLQALGGAIVLLNLSASNETIGKNAYRTNLVMGQSGRCIAAYAYAGSGPTESTTDLVFGGHCLIAENGILLGETNALEPEQGRFRGTSLLTRDVDIEKLAHDRRDMVSFGSPGRGRSSWRMIPFELSDTMEGLQREVSGTPFVPKEGAELDRRCHEIFAIQCAGLAKRIEQLPANTPLNIGVSGGLDSTLALLVATKTCDLLGLDRRRIHGLTMPGFGTTDRTRTNALALMDHLGVASEIIDIRGLALRAFQELGHAPLGIDCATLDVESLQTALARLPRPVPKDLTFENVQARIRTFLLMSRGFVIGTGDLSELALGWSTYNADHMSMYNPNCSIPKTLVRFLVRYVALHEFAAGPARDTLLSIVDTIISPELLPAAVGGEIEQSTEATLGPYEIHDFILYYFVRFGFSPEKILFLSDHATFTRPYPRSLMESTLRTFLIRFFSQQYKRSCIPDGPKVGTVSLSPRGDWRMPSDADPSAWLRW
jgi:NAD+ synthase (glutamine-hydrolysing)